MLNGEVDPGEILAACGGKVDLGAGQVEALMGGHPAAGLDLAAHAPSPDPTTRSRMRPSAR